MGSNSRSRLDSIPIGSVHINYNYDPKARFREIQIVELIQESARMDQISPEKFRVLDLGCGSGHLLRYASEKGIQIMGVDSDPICVDISKKFSKAILLETDKIGQFFEPKSFDLIVFSHSLEHFDNPLDIMRKAKVITKKWLVIAVPNPCRFQTIIYDLCRINYSNHGHLCCWDRSHFAVFLDKRCNLEVIKWKNDKIGFLGFPFLIAKIIKKKNLEKLGHVGNYQSDQRHNDLKFGRKNRMVRKYLRFILNLYYKLEPLELFGGKVLPFFCDDLIVLARLRKDNVG